MNYGPLLSSTGHAWKVRAAMIGIVFAIAIYAFPFFHTFASNRSALCAVLAVCILLIRVAIAFLTARCPACGSRWLWRAANQPRGRLLQWLRTQEICPDCGSSGNGSPRMPSS